MPMDGPVSNSSSNKENTITIFVLGALTSVYIYLLLSPSQPHLSSRPRNFAIDRDTKEAFNAFYERFKKVQYPTESYGSFDGLDANNTSADYSSEFAHDKHNDDFFMDYDTKSVNKKEDVESSLPNIPSSNFHCGEGWLSIRAEINFKYLWMHASEKGWMGATATLDTPIHRRSFQMVPVTENCEGGWVRLRAAHSDGFVLMVAPTGEFIVDEWVVKLGSDLLNITADDRNYHFLIEDGGYLLNRGSMAFVNVMPEAEYSVRGHTSGWDRTKASGRQYASNLRFYYLEESDVHDSIQLEKYDAMEASMEDKLQIDEIAKFPKSGEKRVISFGIYGSLEKYMVGAVRNAALAAIYFPGWVCRFYIAADVPVDTVIKLRGLGAEIEVIPKGMGYSSGMFWRFMVASDPTVDRYIIRDSDSRLNSRDR